MNKIEIIAVIVGVMVSILCAVGIRYVDYLTESKVTPDDLTYEPLIGDTFTTVRIGSSYTPETTTRIEIDTV